MQPNTLSPANETLIHTYLDIATNTDDMEQFSHLIAQDCVWVMMPTGHTFTGYAQVSTLAIFIGAIGGVAAYGILGLIIGPVLLSFIVALLRFARENRRVST